MQCYEENERANTTTDLPKSSSRFSDSVLPFEQRGALNIKKQCLYAAPNRAFKFAVKTRSV